MSSSTHPESKVSLLPETEKREEKKGGLQDSAKADLKTVPLEEFSFEEAPQPIKKPIFYRILAFFIYLIVGIFAVSITFSIIITLIVKVDFDSLTPEQKNEIDPSLISILKNSKLIFIWSSIANVINECSIIACCLFVVHCIPWNTKSAKTLIALAFSLIVSSGIYVHLLCDIMNPSDLATLMNPPQV
ncbi:hypothetical protein TBLA_0I03550 [Henningerozyma blattae CBS 6284]|uniref:Uncharacterized protein n=1 Tax=Henningerozyma blattae (strain ATCC 34711 / CBS 6284 / DSM 70876 / NBRC 10599 / NRRL Y-10934 / UCD 77-7) TaxID=1071380 RepID=I2H9F6_HENB6|nr:hypothetical protein TBLA_0I03550 [Tetrapisispora blattae CBS 6284]CCH63008.1 hypothetical protein TBLA_0I03550 [Tetrapisispora blattae CBS 6284]